MTVNRLITPFNRWEGRDGSHVGWIVLHYTANVGDTARGEAEYFASRYIGSSAHFFVDEDEVWQSVALGDTAWHCGDAPSRNGCTNRNSIGIEMCTAWDGVNYFITDATVERTAELVSYLLGFFPDATLCRHYDVTGKRCPEPWVREPGKWEEFKRKAVAEKMTETEKKEFDALAARVSTLEAKVRAGEEFDRAIRRDVVRIGDRVGTAWDRLDDMPGWMKPTVEKLVAAGHVKGDENGDLGITPDLARALVILDRAGGFER